MTAARAGYARHVSPNTEGGSQLSLFEEPGEPDSTYEHLKTRASLFGSDACSRADVLWAIYAPYADPNFESEFRLHAYERYWEMYLTCTLIGRGFDVSSSGSGPDVRVNSTGGPVWIEAVAPAPGQEGGADTVPEFGEGVFTYPEDQIILRYRSAIESKLERYLAYVERGVVGPHNPYVVAVSGSRLAVAFDGTTAPDILKAVLPVGVQQIHIRLSDDQCVGSDFTHRPVIQKSSGSPVATEIFLDPAYAGISGVLFCRSDILNPPDTAGSEFIFVHNPKATNPLPDGWLGFGREYRPELVGDGLHVPCIDHESSGSA